MNAWLGIDVGTGSARAGLFDSEGCLLGSSQHDIQMWSPEPGFFQQSSKDIWVAVCKAVRQALEMTQITPDAVSGIGFDATCSMVVADKDGDPVSISPDGTPDQDIIVWMDHRAIDFSHSINVLGGEPLDCVGGRISPEMQLPKLLWLKQNLPDRWQKMASFMDLPDWLVYRATQTEVRSLCSAVCKWTYLGQKGPNGEGWNDEFLTNIGLDDLTGDDHAKLGKRFLAPGKRAGSLSALAAAELGLQKGIPVAASLIDAYAGALGTLGAGKQDPVGRLAVIAGTSTCHITLSKESAFVPGVWGPYFGVLAADQWCNEGGQSAAGAVLDSLLERHIASADIRFEAQDKGISVYDLLAQLLERLANGGESAFLTKFLHLQPDFHGNRSPLAESWRKGAIDGLTLEHGPNELARLYLATLQALSYGTRHIVETMRDKGVLIESLVVSGGLARNRLFIRELADGCGYDILVPQTDEPVLLGSAMLGAVASGAFQTVTEAMIAMAPKVCVTHPRKGKIADYHTRKYQVFRKMQEDHGTYNLIMGEEK